MNIKRDLQATALVWHFHISEIGVGHPLTESIGSFFKSLR